MSPDISEEEEPAPSSEVKASEPHPNDQENMICGESGSMLFRRSVCGVRLGEEEFGFCQFGQNIQSWTCVDFLCVCCTEGKGTTCFVTWDEK